MCVLAAPDWFDQDTDGIAIVRDDWVLGEEAEDGVSRAAYTCPAQAIALHLEEAHGAESARG
jgi:ferredoxin